MLSLIPRYTSQSDLPMSVTSSHDVNCCARLRNALETGTITSANSRNTLTMSLNPFTRSSSLCRQMLIRRRTMFPFASTPTTRASSPSSSAHDDGHGDGGYGGSGSGSRSVHRNGDHHSGPLPTAQGDVPAPGSLHGWLHKRHTHEKSMGKQWAKRYFAVDEHRGTLAY